jgi:hypothetical protein
LRVNGSLYIYTFGEEARLPAGKRVRVHPGNVRDASPEKPGVIWRFAASGIDGAQLRLPSGGAELRLTLADDDAEGHRRHFLSSDAYALVNEADGTGFFVLAPASSSAGTRLTSGQYRLELISRCDNRVADSESLILSEAGNITPERAMIDIPWYLH